VFILREQVPLSGYTTLRLGGAAATFVEAGSSEDVTDAVRGVDAGGGQLLVLGGGSNLVVADEGFPGTVLRIGTAGISVAEDGGRVLVTAAAGENWHRLVEWSVAEKLAGIECLAGIPGLVGATPIQNVGAYGQEVSATVATVTAYDRASGSVVSLSGPECGFGYRTSVFKRTGWPSSAAPSAAAPTGRWVVLDVTFALERDPMSRPVSYAQLAAHLGVAIGERAPVDVVRSAVLDLRRGKGMVLDPADPDTASAGSFFTNPVLSPAGLAELERVAAARLGLPGVRVPYFPAAGGQVKVPAAWLIEHSGFGKGFPGHGAARISSKHTLALANVGGASTADVLGLARQIVSGVRSAFGIELASEPVLVGVSL
jgi:UDP-N-acetylmuramate dehydrogenase